MGFKTPSESIKRFSLQGLSLTPLECKVHILDGKKNFMGPKNPSDRVKKISWALETRQRGSKNFKDPKNPFKHVFLPEIPSKI